LRNTWKTSTSKAEEMGG